MEQEALAVSDRSWKVHLSEAFDGYLLLSSAEAWKPTYSCGLHLLNRIVDTDRFSI